MTSGMYKLLEIFVTRHCGEIGTGISQGMIAKETHKVRHTNRNKDIEEESKIKHTIINEKGGKWKQYSEHG